ncbi:MAG TPA: peptidyl-prolyl cis-trans isomerase [Candidatus Eisenbacteria bacterium]
MKASRLGVRAGLVLLAALAAGPFARAAPARRPARAAVRTPALEDSNRVLVHIGRDVIRRADVQRRIEEMPEQVRGNYATPEGRRQILERMIDEKVWLESAVRHGVPDRPQVRRQIEQQRRDLVIRTYVSELMASNPAPSDSEARLYYDAHVSEYEVPATVTLRHIQTRTESEAKRVLQWARSKQDWNKLVQRYSTDTLTRATGGALGTVAKEGVFSSIGAQPALAESAMALGEGRIGGPFKTDRGWHVIKVESLKPGSTRPFEQMRSMIVRQLGSTRSQDFYKSQLDAARRSLGVAADSGAIESFVTQRRSARDMFRDAQEAALPARRIELYRKLLEEYPKSEVSPQAQFMVGFIYSEELKDYDEAEKAFHALLESYPDSELAPSARWMVEHMRSQDVPSFGPAGADSTPPTTARKRASRGAGAKP